MIRALPLICAFGMSAFVLVNCSSLPVENSIVMASSPSLSEEQLTMVLGAVSRIEPVAKSVCEQTLIGKDCQFSVAVTDKSDTSINAYQVRGKPLIVFTQPMLAIFNNADEAAFVYAHEAAHYILEHGKKRQRREVLGGLLLGGLAMTQGVDASNQQNVADLTKIGSQFGNRIYSVDEEFEADLLGAQMSDAAGFDPTIGVLIFDQTPDSPRGQILPTHPRNDARIAAILSQFQ